MCESHELSPRERRQQRTSQAILDAARQIIQREGVDALSMRAIADRIDYSPATLYEYYGGKDEIIQAVCWQGHRLLRDRMAAVSLDLPVQDYLVEIGLVYIHFAVANADYFRLMFVEMEFDTSPDRVQQLVENRIPADDPAQYSSFPILLRGIQRGIDEGVYKPRPGFGLLEMAYGAWSLVHGMATLRIAQDSRVAVDYARTERNILYQFGVGLGA